MSQLKKFQKIKLMANRALNKIGAITRVIPDTIEIILNTFKRFIVLNKKLIKKIKLK